MTDATDAGVVHVESGAFRVDRRRALDKLMRFQLPQAEMFMLPWVRAAVASGATRVRLAASDGALEMRFDGRPFLRAELVDPYSCLFDRYKPENRRNRELAIGLLSVMRLKPVCVLLVSGPPGARSRLRAESVETDRVDPCEDGAPETIIKVVSSQSSPPLWTPDRGEWIERLCRVCPIPLSLAGEEAARQIKPASPPGVYFEEEGLRGWLTAPPEPGRVSTLDTYTLGVFVAPTQVALPRVQVDGYLNDDEFTLSASQTAVARNARFKRDADLLAAKADLLLKQLLEEHGPRMEAAGRALADGDLAYYWRNRLERGAAAEKPSPLEGARESVKGAFKLLAGEDLKKRHDAIADIYWTARVTAWLRDAAARLLQDHETDMKDPLLAALWSAPIQIGLNGSPLSLLDLELQRQRLGYIPVSSRPAPEQSLPFEGVWLLSARDYEVLAHRFPDLIRDVSDHLDALAGPAARQTAAQVSLEQAGIADVLAREPFEQDGAAGEVGLALAPHDNAARVTVVDRGLPKDFFTLESDLRFEAAIELPRGVTPAVLSDALRRAALQLYPKLVAEYDCWKVGERNGAIRGHLFDYLAATRAPEYAAQARWCETVPLFDCVDSWLDFERLRGAVAEGRPVFLAPDRSAALALPGKMVLVGKRFTPEFLKGLLPGAEALDIPGRAGLRVLVSAPPEFHCAHPPGQCAAERTVGATIAHIALGPGPGQRATLPWGSVRILAPAPLSAEEVESLGQDYRLLIEAVSALLKRRGTALDDPGSAERGFLLDALEHLLAPWPGRGPARPRQNLVELLDAFPLFREASAADAPERSPGWPLTQVTTRLAAGAPVTYVRPQEAGRIQADLILDEREEAFLRALVPGWQRNLQPGRTAAQAGTQGQPPEAAAQAAAAPPPPAADYTPPPHLAFDEPMLFSRVYHESGLAARIGLPARAQAPSFTVFRNGKPVDWPDAPRSVGLARVEIGGWSGPAGASRAEAVQGLLHRFALDLADHWPVADMRTPQHDAAVEQVLRLLLIHREPGAPAKLAAEEDQRLRRLRLFRTLGGSFAGVDDMILLSVRRGGTLPYSERDLVPPPKDAAESPVVTPAIAKLLAAVIGCKAEPVKAEPAPGEAPEAEPGPAAAAAPNGEEDKSRESEAITRARDILRHLRGRRGLKLRNASLDVASEADPEAPLITVSDAGGWILQAYHPTVMAILSSSLAPAEQATYLASAVYTAANRELEELSDLDDITFHQALADFVAGPDPGPAPADPPQREPEPEVESME